MCKFKYILLTNEIVNVLVRSNLTERKIETEMKSEMTFSPEKIIILMRFISGKPERKKNVVTDYSN